MTNIFGSSISIGLVLDPEQEFIDVETKDFNSLLLVICMSCFFLVEIYFTLNTKAKENVCYRKINTICLDLHNNLLL